MIVMNTLVLAYLEAAPGLAGPGIERSVEGTIIRGKSCLAWMEATICYMMYELFVAGLLLGEVAD